MSHVIQPAPTGRAKCRGCGERIAAGELRFGESLPNAFGEGEAMHWYHPLCGAYKRPEAFLATLEERPEPIDDAEKLRSAARDGITHRRAPRITGAERAPSGRAHCRSCKAIIDKDAWRITLVYFEESRFVPSGSIHPRCAQNYFETIDVLPRIRHFAPALTEPDLQAIAAELALPAPAPSQESSPD